MATISLSSTVVARAAAALYGVQLGASTMNAVLTEANYAGGVESLLNTLYARDFGGKSNASVAATIVSNLGITGANASDATDYVAFVLGSAPANGKGAAVAQALNAFAGMGSDATFGAAATAFNSNIAAALAYAQRGGTVDAAFGAGAGSLTLALGQDFLTGTPGNDTIIGRIIGASNSLESGDWIDGGAGTDRLSVDLGATQGFAITPETKNVEAFAVRAQSRATDSGDNNVAGPQVVKVDAQRMVGVNHYESTNSRADVILEDVRILDSQITKDITIAFVESDPGHVDFGVYFDQYSLRNQVSSSSSINLRVIDTVAAAAGKDPLLNSNYGGFKFTVTINGTSRVVDLKSQAIQDAQTYTQLAAAFQAALDAELGVGAATATVGNTFTVVDPDSRQAVTGNEIVLTTKSAAAFTTPAGSGWLADGTAPPQSNFYTNYTTGSTSTASLVTSTVILDDVGRGSTGGDLVIGGLSTGATSSSLGVQRFEIEVRDNSKLETISSTNNTLREVVLTNGVTTSNSNAYVTTVKDAGKLTVNGNAGANGASIATTGTTGDAQAGDNALLPGGSASIYGFQDVRLIDGSAMRGDLAFSAAITSLSVSKYLNARDIQALPAGDNIAFTYNGGTANDTLFVRLDPGVTSSRNTIVSGREDFTFTANGGTGNDTINVAISTGASTNDASTTLTGGTEAWYTNQKLNANLTVNGGDGNDTIRTPGAGDYKINGDAGNDTIYADNTGTQGVTVGQSNTAGAAYTAAEAAELGAAQAVALLQNNTDAGKTLAALTALNATDLLTPVSFTDPTNPLNPNPALPAKAALQANILAAVTAGHLTTAQGLALIAAYNTSTVNAGQDGVTVPNTLVTVDINPAELTAVAGALTAGEFAAGNTLLASYITAARAAWAEANAAEVNWAQQQTLLNATQLAQVTAHVNVNGGSTGNPGEADVIGTATTLAAWQALKSALTVGTTLEAGVAAITAAWRAGAFGDPDAVALNSAVPTSIFNELNAVTLTVADVADLALILDVAINNANNANVAATTALATATATNNTAVRTASNIVGADPVAAAASGVLNDSVGSTETAAAQVAAQAALTAFNNGTLNPLLAVQNGLSALKAALAVNVSELNANILISNAQAAGTIGGGDAAALLAAANAAVPTVAGVIDATEKVAIDLLITALQFTNDNAVVEAQARQANLQAVVTATTFAAEQAAAAAANASGGSNNLSTVDKAVWVLNTANQAAVTTTPGTGYVLNVNDERNVADLKSDANNNHNFFNTKVTVTFKGITATADVPNTSYRSSDLQVNQGIKNAINNDPVLSKLLSANDGPGNTLIISSLIDGVMSDANLDVALTLPGVNSLNNTEITAAAALYGVAATEAAVLGAMAAAKTAFDTKGDYVDRLAETGSLGGNVNVTGAASITTSDNTINGGAGNDVMVLGTTVGLTSLTSSNDVVVFQPDFGNDTVVHFRAGSLATGGDVLNLSGLGGSVLSTAFNVNRSINVADEAAAINGTAALVAALYTDSATAQTHVYVAVDTLTNVGKVYQVVDAAGTGAGSVTATLAGTIDLADTLWSTLTADNFA